MAKPTDKIETDKFKEMSRKAADIKKPIFLFEDKFFKITKVYENRTLANIKVYIKTSASRKIPLHKIDRDIYFNPDWYDLEKVKKESQDYFDEHFYPYQTESIKNLKKGGIKNKSMIKRS